MKNMRILAVILLLGLVITLTACDVPFSETFARNKDPSNSQFYEGSRGVEMRFSDTANPPPRMYYFSDAEPDDNAFSIFVDLHNVGASWTRGGIFVSGYDPSMIRIQDIDIPRYGGGWSDCVMDFGFFGANNVEGSFNFWDLFGGQIGCAETGVGGYTQGADNWGLNINSLGQLFGDDNEWWSNIGMSYDNQYGNPTFGLNIDDNFNMDFLNRGKGLLILLSGLNFERYNGKEYLLHPDDYDYPGGEITMIPFDGEVYNWPQGLDQTDHPVKFLVTNCYAYTTYAAPQVCIDPAPLDEGRKVCIPKKITYNGGNGAPVAVSSIEQENTRKRIYFTINVRNVGGGDIFDMGYLERCSPYYPGRLSTLHVNKVYVVDARIGNTHLQCTPDRGDGVRLVDGRGQFRCFYDLEYQTAKSAYETPLIVELAYGYGETMMRSTTIKRAI